ncbi:MAG TPA: hypothetical protein VHS58_18775, partial [Acetobacteraceae bacterium]|nr:hypothetical protein [Acetobacteraceae bacterium]
MADQSDVETALAALVSATLYPNGAAAASVVGSTVRIYRGWPNQTALNADLANGVVNVTVFPEVGHQRNTTRFPPDYVIPIPAVPTLAVTCAGTTATFAGSAAAGQLAGLLANNVAAVHRTATGDTPEMVAAVLATRLATMMPASAAGAVVTVAGAWRLIGRVVADQPALMEARRQQQGFRITCWCPDPATRDACAVAIDTALAQVTFLTLADG